MRYYHKITNNFPSGLYQYIRLVSLYDEHDFFIRISQSFPLMKRLSLINHNSSIVKYNNLIKLNIDNVHDDYIEEFLFNTRTYFFIINR
jgi:hypothetical protein